MAIVSDVEIRLRADIARLQQDLTRARQQVSNFTGGVKNLLGGIAAGFSLAAVVSQVVSAQREFDKLHSSLVTVTGSSAGASKAFEAIQKLAAQTPFDLQQVTESFLKLRNMGLTPSERAIMSYGNTAAAMGKNLNQMIEAVADATTGEFERLKEFGIKAKQNGDQVSLTFQGTTKTIGNNAKEIEAYLLAIGEVQFAGGMERQAATLDGALSNLGDTFLSTLTAFSQGSGFGDLMHGSVLALTEALSDLGAMFKAIGGAAENEGEKVKAIAPLHAFLTTTFEALTVVGTNIAYVFQTIGKDIGAFAAQAVTLFNGGFQGLVNGSTLKAVQDIGRARVEEAKKEREEVDAASARIMGAAKRRQEAEAQAAEERKKGVVDALAGYKLQGDGVKQLSDKEKKAAEAAAKEAKRRLEAYRDLESQVNLRVAASERELDGLQELSEAEKFDIQLTEELRLGKRHLTKEQEAYIRSRNAEAGANVVLAKSNKEYTDMLQRMADYAAEADQERERLVESAREEAEQNEWLVKTFGKSEEAIARMEVARIREQMVQKLGRELNADEIEDLERLAALKERSAKALANKRELEKTRDFWKSIEETAHDTFVSIADGGKDAFQRLKETAKNTFFDWLYQQTIKKWIINIQANGVGSTVQSLFGKEKGIAGWLEAGKNLVQGFSQNLSKGIGDVISKLGTTFGSKAATSFGSNISSSASAGGIAAAVVAGMMANNKFYDQGWRMDGQMSEIIKNQMSSMLKGNGFAPLISVMTASMGTFDKLLKGLGVNSKFASMLSGSAVFARAFGLGPREVARTSLDGTFQGSTFSGGVTDIWKQKGGWFRSDVLDTVKRPEDAALTKMLADTYKSIVDATARYADALGLNSEWIKARTQNISIALTGDPEKDQKAITDFFGTLTDDLAKMVFGDLDKYTQAGETASATLQRLAVGFKTVDAVLQAMGLDSQTAFGAVGAASIAARERLLALAGGVDSLASQTAYFVQNFLTEAEQIALVQKPLREQLAALGFASVTTTDQFKAALQGLMQSGAAATEEGAKQIAGLLALAPQLKAVDDYYKKMADEAEAKAQADADKAATIERNRRELQAQIMELEGNALGALALRRQMELEQTEASLRPLIERVHALEDEAAAAEKLAAATSENEQALLGLVDKAMEALGRAVQAQKDKVTAAYKESMKALEASIGTVNAAIERTTALAKAIKGAITQSPGDVGGMRAQVARAQITAALAIARASGMLPTQESLADALSAVAQDEADNYTTLAEYQRAVARTNAELEALGGLTDKELTNAEKQLKALEEQKAATTAAYEAELARLDSILSTAQAQVDAVKGVDNSVRSVESAVAALGSAISALKTAPTAANPGGIVGGSGSGRIVTVEDLYREVLGREADAGGLAFWKNYAGDSVDQAEYLEFMKGAQIELQNRITAPPVVATSSGTMSSSSAMVVELQTLNRRMESVEVNMANTAKATDQFAAQFHQVSGGGNALATEII